jgi:CheY-like chemotaxis protein
MNLEMRSLQAEIVLLALNGMKILVVDDDADARVLLTYLFEDYGAAVAAVCSAQEALAAIEQWQPHLLISDIGMPNEDGHSLISKVRDLKPDCGGQVPAIAVTGYDREPNAPNHSSQGFQIYLTKPVDLDALLMAAANLTKMAAANLTTQVWAVPTPY